MPNHVSNKLIFDSSEADRVFSACFQGKNFDFNTLIPQPLHIYNGNLSRDDDEDFKCNWNTWNRENWGTKWNAYSCSSKVEDGKAIITFNTAWSIPYPVMAAFANKFRIKFEHRYFDEGHNFWGIENWDCEDGRAYRINKQQSNNDDKKELCIELLGYDPDADNDSGDAA